MTCILITETHIYTDTLHKNEAGEEFHSLTKVKKLKEPVRVKWTALESEPVTEDFNSPSFVDTIHGYTCSGNNFIADLFIDKLVKDAIKELARADLEVKSDGMLKVMIEHGVEVKLNRLLNIYKLIVSLGFVNAATHGTIVLIGEKACYPLEITSRHAFLGKISRDNPTSYGTGATYASKVNFTTGDPVLSMYTAFWYDSDASGGMIDIWEMPTEEVPKLRRVGVCNQRSLVEIREIIVAPTGPDNIRHPDLISTSIFLKKMKDAAKLGEQVGYARGVGSLKDPMKRAVKTRGKPSSTTRVKQPAKTNTSKPQPHTKKSSTNPRKSK